MSEPVELLVKSGGRYRSFDRQFVRSGGAFKKTRAIYRKEDGAWVKWWPLTPPPVDNVSAQFVYRNDVIECDVQWAEYVGDNVIVEYELTVTSGSRTASFILEPGVTSRTLTNWNGSPGGWQALAGSPVTFSVVVKDDRNRRSPATESPRYTVPQLPAPPDPTGVALTISSNLVGTLSWSHGGGNRLSSFEIATTYSGKRTDSTAGKAARSQVVTAWSTSPRAGYPGGTVASMVRAVGPGGASNWVSSTGVVPSVPVPPPVYVPPPPPPPGAPPPPPPPAPTPPPPAAPADPPPAKVVPGTVSLTNHRFKSGVLEANFTWPTGAVSIEVYWQKWSDLHIGHVYQGLINKPLAVRVGTSAKAIIAASSGWARNKSERYRIEVRAVSADGTKGAWTRGPWARKMPNPFYIRPEGTASLRDGVMQSEGGVLVRQGASANVKRWAGYAAYGGRTRTSLHPNTVGYMVAVTKAQVLLERDTTGGSGGGVRPRLYFHVWDFPHQVGTALATSGQNLSALNRGAWGWRDFSTEFANHLIHPDVNPQRIRGLAVYNPNMTLNSSLGNVSNEYMRLRGAGSAPWRDGHPIWTLKLWHDG